MKSLLAVLLGGMLSGLLFCLALPPADVWWLGWFAFVPLFVAVRGRGFIVGFGGALLAMFVCAWLAQSGWLYRDGAATGSSAWILTGCGLFGFAVSIVTGIWADAGALKRPIWWFAFVAVALEACLLVQLPAHIALTQYRRSFMLFLATQGGIWLVSFLVWLANFWIADALRSRKYRLLPIMPLCLVVSSMWTWPDRAGDRRVAVVQTEATDEQTLKRLQSEATSNGALVAVWPEFSGLELAPGGNTEQLEKLARESGGGSFVTTFRDGFEPLPHNAAALVSPKGASAEYFKRHLFGGEKNMHTAGDRPIAVEGPFGRVGLEICFDSCYPRAIRETVRLGDVGLVALPTIDPESPHGFIAAVHAAFTSFRAAENGVPIARADGIAHSMIVDGDGRILAELQGGQGVASATISPPVSTLYRKLGDWFLYLSLVGIVAGFFLRKDDQRIDLLTTLPSGLRS